MAERHPRLPPPPPKKKQKKNAYVDPWALLWPAGYSWNFFAYSPVQVLRHTYYCKKNAKQEKRIASKETPIVSETSSPKHLSASELTSKPEAFHFKQSCIPKIRMLMDVHSAYTISYGSSKRSSSFRDRIYTPPPLEGKKSTDTCTPSPAPVVKNTLGPWDEELDTPPLKILQYTFGKNQHHHCIDISLLHS